MNDYETNREVFKKLQKERPDLYNRWVVIFNGKLQQHFEEREEAIEFAYENVSDEQSGIVSLLNEKQKKKKQIRWQTPEFRYRIYQINDDRNCEIRVTDKHEILMCSKHPSKELIIRIQNETQFVICPKSGSQIAKIIQLELL